jgi:hypothetical protein
MNDIDRAKALAALEQLEAEKDRRIQARVDSGEMVSVQTVSGSSPRRGRRGRRGASGGKAPGPDDGREVHRKFFYIFTGVPRDPDHWKGEISSPQAAETSASEGPSRPSEEPAASIGTARSPRPATSSRTGAWCSRTWMAST